MGNIRKRRAATYTGIAIALAVVLTPIGTSTNAVAQADESAASQPATPLPSLPGIGSSVQEPPAARPPRAPTLAGQAAKAAQASAEVNDRLAKLPSGATARPAGAPKGIAVGEQDCGTLAKDRAKLTTAGIKSVLCTEVSKGQPRDPKSLAPNGSSNPPTTNLEPNPTPGQMPVWCSDNDYNVLYDRFKWCQQNLVTVRDVVVQTGEVVGWGLIYEWEWVELSNKAPTWQHRLELNMYEAEGTIASGTQIVAQLPCANCTSTAVPAEAWVPLEINKPLRGYWNVSGYSAEPNYTAQRLDLSFYAPGSVNVLTISMPQPNNIRCDDVSYISAGTYGGCVFPEMAGWFQLSLSVAQAQVSTRHIYDAQANLPDHWAALYSNIVGPPIYRMYDPATADLNRNTSCAGFVKQNPNDSCDEYPFAATYQGAYLVGKNRTSVAHVPVLDNSYGGSLYSAFLTTQRMIDGDPFWITVYP